MRSTILLIGAGLALVLAGCGQGKETVSTLTSTETTEQAETTAQEKSNQLQVLGSDEVGYLTFSQQMVDFEDYDKSELVNIEQWMEVETGNIVSLTSYAKYDYTDFLKKASSEWAGYQEVDVLMNNSLGMFQSYPSADISEEKDYLNEMFYDSSLGYVTLEADNETMTFVSLAFQPQKDSDKVYFLSVEGTDDAAVLDLFADAIKTWAASK